MKSTTEVKNAVVILFAGDSGDGIQLTGSQFTTTTALYGNDVSTFPNYPAEIRAPQGTIAGVSGFQLHFGSEKIYTAGDASDVLVVMNAAALKANLKQLKPGGIIIANTDGFDAKNLKLAKYPDGVNPLQDGSLEKFIVHEIDVTKLVRVALADSGLGTKEIDRSKNMFVLGFIYWMYNRKLDNTIEFIKEQFKKRPDLIDTNIKVLKVGYNYGDTIEAPMNRFEVKPAPVEKGTYRSIMGNQATAYGLVAAAQKSGLTLFLGSYPITPATDILHELAKYKNYGVKTFQAEDEIAAITSSIGAAFGGALAVTTSSGPGIALKGEAIGLALMLELPLVIINVQRGGPSTGLPTKTEQADLLQAMYGRNGESPVAIVAAYSPSSCFDMAFEACRLALEFMTPVFLLTDGYIANGSEPWKFPAAADLKDLKVSFAKNELKEGEKYLPYKRNERLSRPWAIPGTKGLEHRIGGIEKENETGNISYDPENHEFMVKLRQAKIDKIADYVPLQTIDQGKEKGKLLVLGWGSTYGSIKTAVKEALAEGYDVSHAHVKYLNPFPKNLGEVLKSFDKVLIPEMNNGQLIKIIRDKYFVDAKGLNKIKGMPFTSAEIKEKIKELI
ncbi:MAG: 2-oxoglutarate ferredoxin oxidoreductase subunit alpha [Bacteroidetes bacterium RIFCSPLOWO2_12_FULL_35_15]|nr:MAG: 2-oxoglutarate ferredoxin oxidoreductase subunit alpha [Bacteroidetes bacterium RIFCSPLOWO2_12_FULL_35_15]